MPQKNPLQNRNRTAQWTHNERGKVRSPTCLGSCIALFLHNPPRSHFQKRWSCPSSSPDSSRWDGKPQTGRENRAYYLRDHLKKILRIEYECDIVRQAFRWIVLLGNSSHWQIEKIILDIFLHPALLHGEQYGKIGKCSLKVLQVVFQELNYPPSKNESFVPG